MRNLPNASPPHRSAKACRGNPFLDANAHLSLGEIALLEELQRLRLKMVRCGAVTPDVTSALRALNRVPRRYPIYPPVEKVPA